MGPALTLSFISFLVRRKQAEVSLEFMVHKLDKNMSLLCVCVCVWQAGTGRASERSASLSKHTVYTRTSST